MGAFDLLQERGAFARAAEGRYRVDLGNRQGAVDAPSAKFLTLQGERDHSGARAFLNQYGKVGAQLQGDLDRIGKRNIPVDIVLKQRREVLGA